MNVSAFDQYIERLKDDTKTAESNPAFYKVMADLYENFLEHDDGKFEFQNFELALSQAQQVSTIAGMAKAISKLTPQGQTLIIETLSTIAGRSSQIVSYTSKAMGVVNKVGGNVVLVTLCAIQLTYEAIKNLKQWWNGEISGKRCAKNLIDATFTVGAGVGGGIGGAALGTLLGPIGTLAGGFIGGIIASNVAELLIDRLTRSIFDLPKEVTVENAYSFLGVSPAASNSDINTAYRKLCLEHHPDKNGGDHDKFLELQSQMGIIKLHRKAI